MDMKNEKAKLAAIKFIRLADERTPASKWNNIVRNFGNDSIMQKILIDSSFVPDESLSILIDEKHLRPNYCLELLAKRELSESMIRFSIVPATNENGILNFLKECYDNKIKIPNKNLFNLSNIYGEKVSIECLKCINDDELINDILDVQTPKEEHLSAIASNYFISDSTRNRAFDLGCDYLKVENPTDKMAVSLCDSWMATIFDNVVDTSSESGKLIQTVCLEQLTKLIQKNVIPDEKLIELCEKCEKALSTPSAVRIMPLYSTIAQYTHSKNVINVCYNSSHFHIKVFAVCNDYADKDISKEFADTLFGELSKASKNDDYSYLSSLICMLAKRTELSSYAYNYILNNKLTDIQIEVAKSETTPISVLKVLQKRRQNQQIVRTAEFNEKVYHGGILYTDEYKKVLNAFNTERNKEGLIAVNNIALISRKESLDETLKILREIADKTTTANLKKNILFYAEHLETYSNAHIEKMQNLLYEYNKERQKLELQYNFIPEMTEECFNECIEKFSTPSLKLIYSEIKYDYFNMSDVDKYKTYEAKERLLNAIKIEVHKRDREISKEETVKGGEIDEFER